MKVLNIISDTNIGGAGMVLENYLRHRDRDSFELSVALPSGSLLTERITPFGVPVYELEGIADKSMDMRAVRELKKVIRRADPDIVHTHGAFAGRIAGRQCGRRVVVTRHSAFPLPGRMQKQPFRTVYRLLTEHYADRIICVSPICRDYLTEIGVREDLFSVVINGVERKMRADEAHCAAMRKKLGTEGMFTAGSVARIEPYKGQDVMVRAARILKDRGRKIKLVAAGTGSFEPEVKALAVQLGVEDSVVFPGFVREVPELLSVLDVQLSTSHIEATSLSLLEGFSMGVPAVVSDIPGNAGVVTDGVTGRLFPDGDAGALADVIEQLMDSPGLLQTWGENAAADYESRFTGEAFARRIEQVYREVMEVRK